HLGDISDPSERAALQKRLLREAQSAGILSHPGIVTVHQIAQEGDIAYIVMELVDGPNLASFLAQSRVPEDEAFRLLRQAAEALDYAHRCGVVHRDIKPANLLIAGGERLKIADFGIARLDSHTLTRTSLTAGSPYYMSPEQARTSAAADGRSDQYSLAVVAYE